MAEIISRARVLLQWPRIVSVVSWPVAIALMYSQVELAERYVPLPAGFADITFPLAYAGFLALKALLGWALLALLAGVLPYMFWGISLPAVAALCAPLAISLIAPGPAGLTSLVAASPWALVVVMVLWAEQRGADVRHWFYCVVPRGAIALCALGFTALWAGQFPLRVPGGRYPMIAVVLLAVIGIAALWPVLKSAPGRLSQIVVLGAAIAFLSTQSSFLFEDNYRIFPQDEVHTAPPDPLHLVLIVVDTLRADSLDLTDPGESKTPHIAALAAESVVFENAIAPSSWTYPSMVSLMTGVAPLRDYIASLSYPTVDLPPLAHYLQRDGYYTRGIVGNHLLYRPYNVAAGFHRIETFAAGPVGELSNDIGLADRDPERFAHGGTTRYITDCGIDWIERSGSNPSFLWLHYFDPHQPYLPPVEDLPEGVSVPVPERLYKPNGRNEKTVLPKLLYDAEVRFLDRELGRFLAALKQARLYDDALIVLTSDHGEEFWEHGGTLHGSSLYQELLHVPLLIRLPGGRQFKRVHSRVPTQALLPTVLELAGIRTNLQPGWVPSLTALMKEGAVDRYEAPIISGAARGMDLLWSVVQGNMKYIEHRPSGLEEIYDLDTDPAERHSLRGERPEFAEAARRVLEQHRAFAERTLSDSDPGRRGDEKEWEERLRSIGYVD